MPNKKMNLEKLEINSFVTSMETKRPDLKGGLIPSGPQICTTQAALFCTDGEDYCC